MRFLMLDRITTWRIGAYATAIKNVALSEDFFDDHFPSKPILPGVLVIEGMAQLAGLLLEESVRHQEQRRVKALLSLVERAKFRRPAVPGDRLYYRAALASVNELGGRCTVEARAESEDGPVVASAGLVFTFHAFENETLEARRAAILDLWLRDCEDRDSIPAATPAP